MKTTNPFIASVCDQSGEVVELTEAQGQIAEADAGGWIAYTGQSIDPLAIVQVYTPSGGSEFGMAGDFDFTPPTTDDYDNDPIGAVNDFITKYRILVPTGPDQSLIASLTEALEQIRDGRGVCSTCGILAVGEGSGYTACGCVRPTWAEQDPQEIARNALASAKGAKT